MDAATSSSTQRIASPRDGAPVQVYDFASTVHRCRGFSLLCLLLLLAGCSSGLKTSEYGNPITNSPEQLSAAIDQILLDHGMEPAWWGIHVVRVSDGETLYARDSDRSFMPASNTKLYTTAAGLSMLGPEFKYETRLFATGRVVDGRLQGDLLVRGAGDPAIGGRFTDGDRTYTFREWAAQLKAAGIELIEGDIVGDDNLFDDVPLGFGWSWDDEPYWYSAEISALTFNDNTVDIALSGRKPGAPAILTWEPVQTSYAWLTNASVTIPADSTIVEGYTRRRASNEIHVTSRVPAGSTEWESLSISNPTRYFVHVLKETLIAEGIDVLGDPVDIDDRPTAPDYSSTSTREIATHVSKPLKDIAHVINKRSQNLYAEQLLKTIGAHFPVEDSDAEPGSAWMGLEAASDFFGSAGVDTSRFRLVDGSGLSRYNLISPEMTTALLRHMATQADDSTRAAFLRSLPVAGVDGTLGSRMEQGPAYRNARAKTGTLNNASALSGYVLTQSNTQLAFSLMGNHYIVPTSRARDVQDRIVQVLATYLQ